MNSLTEFQLEFQADDARVGLDIPEAEVGVLAILDLGDTALATAKLGGHLRLGEPSGHPGEDELINHLGLGGKLANSIGHPAITMPAEHLIDATVSPSGGGWRAGERFGGGHD
jgi:hypothetical protein